MQLFRDQGGHRRVRHSGHEHRGSISNSLKGYTPHDVGGGSGVAIVGGRAIIVWVEQIHQLFLEIP